MANKRTKIMLTYVMTIVVTIIIIFIVAIFMIKAILPPQSEVSSIEVTSASETVYAPSVLDNQTTLFILDTGDDMTSTVFLLARMVPSERKLVIVPLPSDMYAVNGGTEGTIFELYKESGESGAKRAVESALKVTVDKYMIFDKASFEKAAAHFETVSYEFPYSVIYENEKTGEVTVIREGNCALDPATMRKAFTYPEYKNGETTRTALVGTVITDMINSSHSRYRTGLDQIVSGILNCGVKTDITDYDYDFKKEAMAYMAEKSEGCAELVLPSGNYDYAGRYVPDAEFVQSLKTWFSLDTFSTESVPSSENSSVSSVPVTESNSVLPAAYSAVAPE